MDKIGLSQTTACAVAACNPTTFRRVLRQLDDGPLRVFRIYQGKSASS